MSFPMYKWRSVSKLLPFLSLHAIQCELAVLWKRVCECAQCDAWNGWSAHPKTWIQSHRSRAISIYAPKTSSCLVFIRVGVVQDVDDICRTCCLRCQANTTTAAIDSGIAIRKWRSCAIATHLMVAIVWSGCVGIVCNKKSVLPCIQSNSANL